MWEALNFDDPSHAEDRVPKVGDRPSVEFSSFSQHELPTNHWGLHKPNAMRKIHNIHVYNII